MEKYEFSKNIESNFEGKNLSNYGGMLSVGEFLISKLNLKELLKKLIKQNCNPKKVKYKQKDVIFQKIIAIIAGYTTNNSEKYLKNDKVLKVEEIISLYNGRATVETVIEEAKNGFGIDKLSHKRFEVNKSVFQIHLLTMQTVQLYRKFSIGIKKTNIEMTKTYSKKEYNGKFNGILKIGRKLFSMPTIQTIRKIILEIPTSIVKGQRKTFFQFERTFGGKKVYEKLMHKLRKLPTLIIPI